MRCVGGRRQVVLVRDGEQRRSTVSASQRSSGLLLRSATCRSATEWARRRAFASRACVGDVMPTNA
eukprot:10632400-Alexandrium_andersonii.AAC.1